MHSDIMDHSKNIPNDTYEIRQKQKARLSTIRVWKTNGNIRKHDYRKLDLSKYRFRCRHAFWYSKSQQTHPQKNLWALTKTSSSTIRVWKTYENMLIVNSTLENPGCHEFDFLKYSPHRTKMHDDTALPNKTRYQRKKCRGTAKSKVVEKPSLKKRPGAYKTKFTTKSIFEQTAPPPQNASW